MNDTERNRPAKDERAAKDRKKTKAMNTF